MKKPIARLAYGALTAIAVAGCASSASEIRATYVSPIQYEGLTCKQIGEEAKRVSRRAAELSGVQDRKATQDAVATTVGVLVLWRTLFMVEGDGQTAAELGRLKGEFEALEKVAVKKGCDFEFRQRKLGSA
jgi:hypothetical protein